MARLTGKVAVITGGAEALARLRHSFLSTRAPGCCWWTATRQRCTA